MRFEAKQTPLPDYRTWGASSGGYHFVIGYDDEDHDDPEWTGYIASWKSEAEVMMPFNTAPAHIIEGGPFKRFIDAERACEQMLKKLKAKH
jgi:hypothetical protein